MIPIRLTLLLLGFIVLLLLVLGNPEPVTVSFLFWSGVFETYKVIIAAFVFGIVCTVVYTSHLRYIRKIRTSKFNR